MSDLVVMPESPNSTVNGCIRLKVSCDTRVQYRTVRNVKTLNYPIRALEDWKSSKLHFSSLLSCRLCNNHFIVKNVK